MLNHKVCYLKCDSLYTPPLIITKFLTRHWDQCVEDIFKFGNVTELQVKLLMTPMKGRVYNR
jgi:hypothetical protein